MQRSIAVRVAEERRKDQFEEMQMTRTSSQASKSSGPPKPFQAADNRGDDPAFPAGPAGVACARPAHAMPVSPVDPDPKRTGPSPHENDLSRKLTALLKNPKRAAVYDLIRNNPGINISTTRRRVGLSWSVTMHHLERLERSGAIVSMPKGRERHYFEGGRYEAPTAEAVSFLANKPTTWKVAVNVIQEPGVTQRDLADKSGLSPRMTTYHLGRLDESGLVLKQREGRNVHAYPTNRLFQILNILASGPVSDEGSRSKRLIFGLAKSLVE